MRYKIASLEGRPLRRTPIELQGAKNSMLNNLCVPLLTDEACFIENAPSISDIRLNLDILSSFGASVEWQAGNTVRIQCAGLRNTPLVAEKSLLTTGSKLFIPMMVYRFGEYHTGPSRGCRLGDRQFMQYAKSLEHFGIAHDVTGEENYRFYMTDRHVSEYRLPFPSFGLTVNAILAASARNLELVLENTCLEPEIDNTIGMINEMGGRIARFGETSIRIERHSGSLTGCRFRNLSDRNAAVTYASLALATRSEMEIENYDNVKMSAFYAFLSNVGATFDCQGTSLHVHRMSQPPAPVRLSAFLYPEFHSDWQPLVSPLLTLATGTSYVEERLFPKRLEHWIDLKAMGASARLINGPLDRFDDHEPHRVEVTGPSSLHGARVVARNLRAGAAMVVAAVIADKYTEIENAEEIERGYEDMPRILRSLGVDIEVY